MIDDISAHGSTTSVVRLVGKLVPPARFTTL